MMSELRVYEINERSFRSLLFVLLALIPSMILITLIHEGGHYLFALLNGWNVVEFQIALLPVLNELEGYNRILVPNDISDLELILLYASGSLHTLCWGYFLFCLFYFLDLPKSVEIFCFLYSCMLVFEMLGYILVDVFLLQYGDWYQIFLLSPIIAFFLLLLGITNLVAFVKHIDIIVSKMNLD